MSKYLLNKFLYSVDRDPDLVQLYKDDPAGTVTWWETERANKILNVIDSEESTWLAFTDDERRALSTYDQVALFEMGAHPFLTLTLFIAMFEHDHEPMAYVRAYADRMSHIQMPYPDIST